MTDTPPPGLRDFLNWVRAYPSLNDPTEKKIWWAVFKRFWWMPFVASFIGETFWHFTFKLAGW